MTRERSAIWDGKDWVETLPITENLWKQLIQETHASAVRNLDASEKLLSNDGSEVISAGLYTYAVEEFGKLLLLVECTALNRQVVVHFKKMFRQHNYKFQAAIEYLRENAPGCLVLSKALFDPSIFDPAIFDTSGATMVKDFETRSAIFYCDIADSGNRIRPTLEVRKDSLERAIKGLRIVLGVWRTIIQKF